MPQGSKKMASKAKARGKAQPYSKKLSKSKTKKGSEYCAPCPRADDAALIALPPRALLHARAAADPSTSGRKNFNDMRGKMQKVGRQAVLFAARRRARPLPGRSPSLPACATTAL